MARAEGAGNLRRTRLVRLAPFYAAALLCSYVVLIFVHEQPPLLGDLCDWTYEGALLARHLHGLPDPAHALKHYPVPNSIVTAVLALLMLVLPWATAVKVFIAGQLSLAFLAMRSLARSAKTPTLIYLIAPGIIFLSVNFWFGFVAFQLGLTLLMFLIAAYLRHRGDGPRSWVLGLLLLALFFTHMVPFTFACLLLILFASQQRRPRLLLQIVPSALFLGWYAIGRFRSGDPDAMAVAPGSFHYGSSSFLLYKLNTLAKSFGFVNPVDARQHSLALSILGKPIFMLLFCCSAVVTVTLLGVLMRSGRAGLRDLPIRSIWAAIAITVPVYLVLPPTLLGISDPGSRVLQTALCVGLFFCKGWPKAWTVAATGSVALAMSGIILFAQLGAPPTQTGIEVYLPAPVELLAKAPYTHALVRYLDLDAGRMNEWVFPTGLFTNREPQVRPGPK